ncbi:thioredoxin domain-containing protein [Plantactinospora endophytica]|uniref:hypothetical protein n=1 Tax=Plantactinospora endophytica TaxID=673535 RepID=UPI001941A676|nr:hypothetical protein [Plantactinospora endophytica]
MDEVEGDGVDSVRPELRTGESLSPLLPDAGLELASALRLPTFRADGTVRLKRLTLVVDAERTVRAVRYPVPDVTGGVEEALRLVRELAGKVTMSWTEEDGPDDPIERAGPEAAEGTDAGRGPEVDESPEIDESPEVDGGGRAGGIDTDRSQLVPADRAEAGSIDAGTVCGALRRADGVPPYSTFPPRSARSDE